ncbi:MAG: hypothetical protein ACI4MB_03760 [Candidatus Coproplasma sp.]
MAISIRIIKLYRHSLRLVTLSLFFRESKIKVASISKYSSPYLGLYLCGMNYIRIRVNGFGKMRAVQGV